MQLARHLVFVPCALDGDVLVAERPEVEAGREVEFIGWAWSRFRNDPAWPHGVYSIKREVSPCPTPPAAPSA